MGKLISALGLSLLTAASGHEGGNIAAAPYDACCAMHRDGSYYSNITTLAANCEGKVQKIKGFVGFDVPSNCSLMSWGCQKSTKDSYFGSESSVWSQVDGLLVDLRFC